MRLLIPLACSLVLLACSSDEKKPAGTNIFGTGGTGGTGGSAGTGGDGGAGGTAGTGATGGSGGSADGGSAGTAGIGGTGGDDAGVEAGDDAAPDAGLDVVVVVDTCGVAERSLTTKQLYAVGATPQDFVTAFNDEVAAMTQPGPFLMRFRGLDSDNTAGWLLDLGPLELIGGGPAVGFASTPATIPFRLGEQHAVYAEPADASFALHFDTVDLPVVRFEGGGQFDDPCDTMFTEQLRLLIPATAAALPFHGSTVGTLLGQPDQDYGGNKASAWLIELAGTADKAQTQ